MSNWVLGQGPHEINANRQVRGRPSIQGRLRERDEYGRKRASCSTCEITYVVPEMGQPLCPLCEQQKITQQVRDALFQATNANNMLLNKVDRLQIQVEDLDAMRSAFEVMSVEDLTFVKSVIYRWQADRTGTTLKPLHDRARRRGKGAPVIGLVVIFRHLDTAEEYRCNSVGGLALAAYLQEAQSLVGEVKAMNMLARAALSRLDTSIDS